MVYASFLYSTIEWNHVKTPGWGFTGGWGVINRNGRQFVATLISENTNRFTSPKSKEPNLGRTLKINSDEYRRPGPVESRVLSGDLRALPLLFRILLKLQVILQPEERNLRLMFYHCDQRSKPLCFDSLPHKRA